MNNLPSEALTIHWHGIHQRYTPFMDGAAHVSQCPIQAMQRFTYRFTASPPGTHWYHSHLVNQRQDGLYGMLIVHPKLPTLPEYSLMVGDWSHTDYITYYSMDHTFEHQYGTGEIYLGHPYR